MLFLLKNWKVPAIIIVLLILAMVFRWDSIGSSTEDGIIIKTSKDRWNGAVWQANIRNGSYSERIISPSWFEAGRPMVEKQEEFKVADYENSQLKAPIPQEEINSKYFKERQQLGMYDSYYQNIVYVTKTKTVQVPPDPSYWLSRNGLTKIWVYLISIMVIWLLVAIITRAKHKKTEPVKNNT